MGDYYFLTVPVKKHIEKFICTAEGPFVINKKQSFIWHIIRPYLIYKVLSGHRYDDIQKSFPGKIKIRIPKSNIRVYGLHPRVSAIGFINKVLGMYFGKELAAFVQKNIKNGRYHGYNNAIEDFCKENNILIEEDITMDALQKLEFRHRNKCKKSVADLSHS